MSEAKVAFVGDLFVEREDPATAIAAAAPYLKQNFHLRMANLEAPLSTRGKLKRSFPWANLRAHPRNIAVLPAGGFEIVNLANNHTMDFGPEALLDTIDLLNEHNIRYVGAGENFQRAWQMEVIEVGGVRIGFLGVEATTWTWIEHDAMPNRPGVAALFVSPLFPGHVDGYRLQHLLETVAHARPQVHALAVNIHWGVSVSHQVCDYQRAVGRALIDHGADVVIGHHPHTLQGVEMYRGRPIFHSLGNFLFDSLMLPPDSAVVACTFSSRGLEECTLRPTTQRDGQVWVLSAADPEAQPTVQLLRRLSADLNTDLRMEGDHLVVTRR